MKYLPVVLFLILSCCVIAFNMQARKPEYDYFRIHIRANSNEAVDQNIKYLIKDKVVDFVTPHLIECDTKSKSIEALKRLLDDVEDVCDEVLRENGFNYTSNAKIDKEHFPTRTYDNVTLEEGMYDALIIELGSGKGDNWWCIVYPPLCFVNNNCCNEQNIKYQSYLSDIIKKCFEKG